MFCDTKERKKRPAFVAELRKAKGGEVANVALQFTSTLEVERNSKRSKMQRPAVGI